MLMISKCRIIPGLCIDNSRHPKSIVISIPSVQIWIKFLPQSLINILHRQIYAFDTYLNIFQVTAKMIDTILPVSKNILTLILFHRGGKIQRNSIRKSIVTLVPNSSTGDRDAGHMRWNSRCIWSEKLRRQSFFNRVKIIFKSQTNIGSSVLNHCLEL